LILSDDPSVVGKKVVSSFGVCSKR